MVWFWTRDTDELEVETRYDNETSEFVVNVVSRKDRRRDTPSGSRTSKPSGRVSFCSNGSSRPRTGGTRVPRSSSLKDFQTGA
jgi:hypothetical protein